MDMTYHVRGHVCALRAVHGHGGATDLPGDADGVWTIITIVDGKGREWECPWGLAEEPRIGDEIVLGCRLAPRVVDGVLR